jgi:selenide,water dikinase
VREGNPEKMTAVNIARRSKVMARSQKLGHCVCHPQKNCPCDVFITENVCLCAGEKPVARPAAVALTRMVARAGCAGKIGQGDLMRLLRGLPQPNDPNILVGAAAGDDAGVYRLDDRTALVQTVDVFTPCVDDPYLFGQIAAANSVSDIYAMGGRPLTALSIVGFPIDHYDGAILAEMLRGGIDKMAEAGCPIIGGHSINDPEPKMGFAVTGLIDPARVIERGRAQPGDILVLTKPLGTGLIAFGAQIGRVSPAGVAEAGASMACLNRDAAELMLQFGAHACTDVTGFGLAGHLVEMARGSNVSVALELERLPVFTAAAACLRDEIVSGAVERNQEYAMAWLRAADPAAEPWMPILYDPQTSGGLLVALPPETAESYLAALHERGHSAASIIGRILAKPSGDTESEILVLGISLENQLGKGAVIMPEESSNTAPQAQGAPAAESCCTTPPAFDEELAGDASDTLKMFKAFLTEANKPGRIDRRTKILMAIILSIAHHCEPCLKSQLKTARAMGISREEIDEAANLAISFGGCTALMFYKTTFDAFAND